MSNQPDTDSPADKAGASRGLGDQDAALKNSRLTHSIARVLAFEGFTMSINGIGSPWIAKSFHLGESGIAGLFAWVSLSAIGALGLSRMIDRVGRRRMLLVCMAGTSVRRLPPRSRPTSRPLRCARSRSTPSSARRSPTVS